MLHLDWSEQHMRQGFFAGAAQGHKTWMESSLVGAWRHSPARMALQARLRATPPEIVAAASASVPTHAMHTGSFILRMLVRIRAGKGDARKVDLSSLVLRTEHKWQHQKRTVASWQRRCTGDAMILG